VIELAPHNRTVLRELFGQHRYLRGLVHGVLAGVSGSAWVDDRELPNVAYLRADGFVIFAGDPMHPAAPAMVQSMARGSTLIGPTDEWEQLIRQIWGQDMLVKGRVAFGPGRWDWRALAAFARDLPPGYMLKHITTDDAPRFAQLSRTLAIDPSADEAFLAGGIGFGVEYAGQFVSGCAGWPAAGMLEIEVQTHPDHRRRGLATSAAAALILYCLEHQIEPCWDAANAMSAGLGTKLGFSDPHSYHAYVLK
jgi:GNAT superfamily N-acetyltransferase